jgi:hypothetical protein
MTGISEEAYTQALGELRVVMMKLKPGQATYDETVARRDEVFAKYGPIFSSAHVEALTKEEFTSFLYFENNRHWDHLYRKGLAVASDMPKLRAGLAILLDESKPIAQRFTEAIEAIQGFGKATASAILTVAYPDKIWRLEQHF